MAKPRIVIAGAGFAGYQTARQLLRRSRGAAEVVLVNPTDYFLYLPLLPEVAGGTLNPWHACVPLQDTLPGARVVLGEVDGLDLAAKAVMYTGPEGERGTLGFDRLVLAAGSVTKLLPIPGIADHAHGFRGIAEALYLHDHLISQIELADAADDPAERAARMTFVVVGAGYTGTEVTAQGQLLTAAVAARHPRLRDTPPRWLLLDTADQVLPGMHPRMAEGAAKVLRSRDITIGLGTSIREATADGVRLTDGRFVPSRTLVWCVGVRPDPLVEGAGLPTRNGRVEVDTHLSVPGHPDVYACGDGAAVPDLYHQGADTPMTAQHAVRQGRLVAHNIAASYGIGTRRRYRHRDLGFVVDLGGRDAVANPVRVPMRGLLAKAVTCGYHLSALPANRLGTAADWLLSAASPRPGVQLGLVPGPLVPLETKEVAVGVR
ncbi:NAD(P)/FAD-dependent oxidoreductase [Dactylosporangium salmoneum]|uniref:FAD/NAD(P)-binding domain-containing protein n=1 Tax=Dactylosporangium salmoneum TaxID=53361 RepID=A0ABP5U6Z8_9ACTN